MHICVVDLEGKALWRGSCRSTPEDIAITVRADGCDAVRIGLETGPLSTCLWHALRKMGLPIVCLDARHAKAALSKQVNKSDRNDACGLAQIVRTGWYREVGVKPLRAIGSARSLAPGRNLSACGPTFATRSVAFSRSSVSCLSDMGTNHSKNGLKRWPEQLRIFSEHLCVA